MPVGIREPDPAAPLTDHGRPERDEALRLARRVGRHEVEALAGPRGAVGVSPPHEILVPPPGDWIAVSSSRSHTSGQPRARCQNRPTVRLPSHATSPRRPHPARKRLPGSMTQNSSPPGSASTTCSSSGSCPASKCSAPSVSAVSTTRCWSSRLVLVTCRCRRLRPVFGVDVAANRRPTWPPTAGRSTPSGSAMTSRSSSRAQKDPTRAGSVTSNVTATRRAVISAP